MNQETPEKGTIFSLDGYEVVVGSDSFAGLFDFSLVPIPAGSLLVEPRISISVAPRARR